VVSTKHFVNVVSLALSLTRGVDARGHGMSSAASAAVPVENDGPLVRGRQPTKFTPANIARIKEWVAQGVGRDEIANRLEVSVGSLQVTCSKLGISLRKRSLTKDNGAIAHGLPQRSIEHAPEAAHSAQVKFALLLKTQNRQAAIDLALRADLIKQLALEASIRGQSVVDLIGKILSQVLQKDLVGELLRNDRSPSKV
jgi:DNA-binding CsgD family transcriptional regulator